MISSGISDVALASVYSEKTRLLQLDYDNDYYDNIARNDSFFAGRQRKLRPEE